jgi:hypothetical protein
MIAQPKGRPDLAVCCRIYPRVSGNPVFGFREKLDLVRLNLETFKEAAGNLKLKMWFLLDNCPPVYEELVRSFFPFPDVEVIRLAGEGNWATFRRQVEILASQTDAELVYFAEDDYIYLPEALKHGVEFFQRHPEAEFLTLYDHADHYTKYIHRLCSQPVIEGVHQWRPVASTCLTFMARRTALNEVAGVLKTFGAGNSDLGIWLSLTKRGVLNPWSFVRSLGDGLFVSASHALAWRYAWKQIIHGKRRKLWAPIPSLATHMETSGLAPGVGWQKIFNGRTGKNGILS